MIRWLIGYAAIKALAAAGVPVTVLSAAFAAPANPVFGGGRYGSPAAVVKSIQQARADAADGAFTRVRYVVVDVERWPATPVWQQHHVMRTYRRIAAMAAPFRTRLIAAPAMDLAGTWHRYLARHLARTARYTWGLDIQAQSQECHPRAYQRWVRRAAAQARAVNPDVVVFRGLTTDARVARNAGQCQPWLPPARRHVTGRVLLRDLRHTSQHGTGAWLNIPRRGTACPNCQPAYPLPAIWLLRHLYGT